VLYRARWSSAQLIEKGVEIGKPWVYSPLMSDLIDLIQIYRHGGVTIEVKFTAGISVLYKTPK
jgi:hypothetical protein